MTRKTPIPLLRDLRPGIAVVRCQFCQELVLYFEACGATSEQATCPSRTEVEGRAFGLVH